MTKNDLIKLYCIVDGFYHTYVHQNGERKKRILSSITASADLPEEYRFQKW
jgi:hypothetical protein